MQEPLASQDDSTSSAGPDDDSHRVVRHRKCASWGRGLLLWERDGKRGYQFEDGQVRTFAEGFFHLLEVDKTSDASVRNTLAGMNKTSSSRSSNNDTPSFGFEDQFTHFLIKYPGGFQGKDWLSKHRGRNQKRHLKRHRDAVIREASDLIGPKPVEGLLANDGFSELHDRIRIILEKTDLVPKRKLADFERLHVTDALGRAFAEVLATPTLDRLKFDTLRTALASAGMKEPGWALVTSVMALVHPKDHTFVHPNIYALQGKLMGIDILIPSQPTAVTYERCRDMLLKVKERLEAEGQMPEDLLDVFDFAWVTLRPAEQEALANIALERARTAAKATSTEADAPTSNGEQAELEDDEPKAEITEH